MTALDTNILIATHRAEHPMHVRSAKRVHELAEGTTPWGLPIFCVAEFLRVVTHLRIFAPPSPLEIACSFVDNLLRSPSVRLLAPNEGYWQTLRDVSTAVGATGNLVFDAAIAALCRDAGALRLITMDHDFSRFEFLDVVQP